MPTKTKRATGRRAVQAKAPTTSSTTIVVRRGALKRFDTMKKKTAGLPVTLMWDRRVGGERRSQSGAVNQDRRRTDRRQQPPFTWSLADFVVVEGPTEPAPKLASKAKKR